MSRGMRVAIAVLGVVVALGAAGCGNDGGDGDDGNGEGDEPTRDQGIEVLMQQGYTQASAECTIDQTKAQDVDVLDVFTRDQVTQRELEVMAAVAEFCLKQFGTTDTTVAPDMPVPGANPVPG